MASKQGGSGERRRYPRREILIPVTVSVNGDTVAGYTLTVSYSGALIETQDPLPPLDEPCEVLLDVGAEQVRARGKVVRIDPDHGQFAVDLSRIEQNGDLLMALCLTEGKRCATGRG